MFSLTKEQKLANLKEIFEKKRKKLINLNKEVQNLQKKINKLQESKTAESSAPSTEIKQPAATHFFEN